jgi:hypothetical protein
MQSCLGDACQPLLPDSESFEIYTLTVFKRLYFNDGCGSEPKELLGTCIVLRA